VTAVDIVETNLFLISLTRPQVKQKGNQIVSIVDAEAAISSECGAGVRRTAPTDRP
jgi:hypothetical protein